MFKYLRFVFTPLLMTMVSVWIGAGGAWMWLGLLAILFFMVGGDSISGEDVSQPHYTYKWLLNANLYLTLPVLAMMLVILAWMTGHGDSDLFFMGRAVHSIMGYDMFAARSATTGWHMLGAILGSGLAVVGYGTNVAHELTHRSADRVARITGRWLLAMGCQTDFAIEHIYGHHRHVATRRDPATAIRGENVYRFVLRSTIQGHRSAWRIEKSILAKNGIGLVSWRNEMLTGYMMSLAIAGLFFVAGGWTGVSVFFAQAIWAKIVLEIVNYMEHYGLAREEGQPVLPRHSWNTNRWMSSTILYSLTRHSAHHEKSSLAFWNLKPYPDAPTMPFGYLTTIFVSLCPPLWNRIMASRLADWDTRYATPVERELARAWGTAIGKSMLPVAKQG